VISQRNRLRGELGPPLARPGEVQDGDRDVGAQCVQARTLLDLELVQLEEADVPGGGGHQPRPTVTVAEQQTGGADPEEVHAVLHELLQQLGDVVLGDEGVREAHERRD